MDEACWQGMDARIYEPLNEKGEREHEQQAEKE